MMVVVTGASGSGKSEYAEGVAVKLPRTLNRHRFCSV
jgi:adenosyl cobinamide kinase/adenosyl cobinamide phosphate guanylyltransferase